MLVADSNQITNLSPLSGLTSLTDLYLGANQIANLSQLSALTSLTLLNLDNNQISNTSPLSGLTSLRDLGLAGNHISNVSPLADLSSLRALNLHSNQISDISPLAGLTNLTVLVLEGNQITNISPLSGLTGLTYLYLNNNQISDISPLAGLTSMFELHLDSNQISDISPLYGLTSLARLYLDSNQISDVSSLADLTCLTDLDLGVNQISDIQPLVNNTGIGSGDALFLNDNPLNTSSINTCIPMLQARGVTIYWYGPPNQSPSQPSNASPASGATSVSLTPTLLSSVFSDPDSGDTHAASQWQITATAGDYSTALFDSETDNSNLTAIMVPSGKLNSSTPYYWHVRYQDNHAKWSQWSSETSFTTSHPPNQPSNIQPLTATTSVSLTPTLQSSPFSDPDTGDNHTASQWQVREISGIYSSPIYDSGSDDTNLTIIAIPSGLLTHSTTYCWHVRHQDGTGLWSGWSTDTFFTTAKGGSPFWLWIILGVAVVVTAGALAYLVGKRRTASETTVSPSPRNRR